MGDAKKQDSQPTPSVLIPLLKPLTALQHLLDQYEDRGIIVGGVAAGLLGKPRLTADIDAVIFMSIDELPELVQAASEEGLILRISDGEAFARKHRVLLLQHEESGIKVDISLGIMPFESEMIARAQDVTLSNLELRLPTPEDLIIMKAVAHRPKDLEDIRAIAASHPVLDRERIHFWVEQFGEALDLPELWKMISQLI